MAGVGFSDVLHSDETWPSVIFTAMMAILGLGLIMYFISTITAFIVSGEISDYFRAKNMNNRISRLAGHIIVCGAGEIGRHIVMELIATKYSVVLIEQHDQRIQRIGIHKNLMCLSANALDDTSLVNAGISAARGVITVLSEDKDNLLLVIAAHQINPSIRIISRCIEEANRSKLIKAGASSVVAPSAIGAMRMTSELVRPTAVSFLDTMLRSKHGLRFDEIAIPTNLAGQALPDLGLPISQLKIVAVQIGDKHDIVYNPKDGLILKSNMRLVVLGPPEVIAMARQQIIGEVGSW
ncbi:MAG: TrkA family potassium uptake protein [Planctomycetes bacterium]|nr:TrkA family potassium uptake protein [Planctomycetota bacterium]